MNVASLQASMRNRAARAAGDERWAGCVSVIVPVYNEAAHVDELLRAIHASPVKKEIIIVDDGSTDGTREKLQAMPLADDVTVIFHEKNCGKGAAIRTALDYARGEYILIQDSDLEYDPQDYPALLQPLERTSQRSLRRTSGPSGARSAIFPGRKTFNSSYQFYLWCWHPRRSNLLQGFPAFFDLANQSGMPSVRVLPGSDREALPYRRKNCRSSNLLRAPFGR